MVKLEIVYLDEDGNKTSEENAKWKIIHEYDEEGNLQKEAWINLKGKSKDETKCTKCS